MKIIALTNQKGGVAKTTTAFTLAAGLAERGRRVLMVDMDAQSNLSLAAGVNLFDMPYTLYDVFKGTVPDGLPGIIQEVKPGLNIVTSGLKMASADMDFTQMGREYMLKNELATVSGSYDYAVIDTPPTLGVATMNALAAADEIIIPTTADVFALQGISQLNGFIQNVRKYCNPGLKVSGLLLTRYNGRTNIAKALEDTIARAAEQLNTKVFKTRVRQSVTVMETQLQRITLFEAAPGTPVAADYKEFIDEYMKGAE